jgi:hypothetical protein
MEVFILMIAQPRDGRSTGDTTGVAFFGRGLWVGAWNSRILWLNSAFKRMWYWSYCSHGVDSTGGVVVNAGST